MNYRPLAALVIAGLCACSGTRVATEARVEAGKLEMESIPFKLSESLGETMRALSFRAHQKGLELIYEVRPDVTEALFGDPGRIRQIVVNLVGNSIKFTEHGEIFVSVDKESESADIVTVALCG